MDFVLGEELNTFSIVARCERTGMLGVGIATHSLQTGARCPHVQANLGAVSTQATTDPRLGVLAINLLELGYSAPKVLAEIAASDPHIEYRQLGIVDRDGTVAARTGARNKPWAGHLIGRNYVAMGNYLTSPRTAQAMAESFESTVDLELDERLLRAIEAGRDAGGQVGGQRSAAVVVCHREVFPWVDLRVDAHEEPIAELRRVHTKFLPVKEHYTLRAMDPERAPPVEP